MRFLRMGSAALLALALAGCETFDGLTDLQVRNENAPDRDRVITQAADNEALISSAFNTWWVSHYHSGYPLMTMGAIADEASASWGNYDMRFESVEPRVPYTNSSTYSFRAVNERPWYRMYRALSSVYDAFRAILGDTTESGARKNALCGPTGFDCTRAWAFGRFVQGMAHGWLALQMDSAFVFDETVDIEKDVLTLKGYADVWQAAERYFLEAIDSSEGKSWTLPSGWMGASGNTLSGTEFAKLIRAQLARWVPQVARNPAQRQALPWTTGGWNTVINYVDNAITRDFYIEADNNLWWGSLHYFNFQNLYDNSWTRGDYKTIGQYDQSGRYAAWLATPVASRNEFLLDTPDQRIHAPGDGTAQGLLFRYDGPSPFPASRGTYHYSFYSGTHEEAWAGVEVGPMIYIRVYELQQIKAEGLIRTGGNRQMAVDIINSTRVARGGMAPVTTAMTDHELMDALIYERRIENYGTCPGCSYFNRRGEGGLSPTSGPGPEGPHPWLNAQNHHDGLVEGTLLHYPVPALELEILVKPVYTYGGVGNEGPTALPAMGGGGTMAPARLIYQPREEREKEQRVSPSRVTSLVRY